MYLNVKEEDNVNHEDVQINLLVFFFLPFLFFFPKEAYSYIFDCIKNTIGMNVDMILGMESSVMCAIICEC